MIVENAFSGGSTVAPRLKQLMKGIFDAEEAAGESG